ncbi:ATP-binding protein [Alcaligenes faecalis]|uniref:AAA family ATPase n=1 Tax=Alcaligenes TaxID=507 RepID=UPI00203F6B0D|nr:ATP-binding protein [Alcaligenes faecalis]MCM2558016.1 ATP-binding protein [Alcaligenes faecalis]MCM2620953.1 ATP-binding protein [Alcaligenes faecalis]MDK7587835.1 ATP-binding protein [Alcaligenes phenolicus]
MNPELVPSLVSFAEYAMSADYSRLRRAGQVIAKEIEQFDPEGARRFRLVINRKGVPLQASGFSEPLPVDGKSRLPLIEEHSWPTIPVFLNHSSQEVFQSFLSDVLNFDLLAAKGISSRLSLLLSGPPGTGKTLLAGHIAAQLNRKLYVVRLDSVISSMLGDTAKNIRSIFDFIAGKNAVLFLDELDAVAKMRDDRNELGELKRVVNTVLQGIDSLDERAIVVAATNHPQMLDPAIWRRFSYKIELENPDFNLRRELWMNFLASHENDVSEVNLKILSTISEGISGAEIEQYALASRRKSIIAKKDMDYVFLAAKLISRKDKVFFDFEDQVDTRKSLAKLLVKNYSIAQSDVARFIGVSRQSISSYLKVSNG